MLEGSAAGKELLVIAGIHGNETCGIEAMQALLPTLSVSAGRVTFIHGNMQAIENNVRFVEQNLNRLFRPSSELSETQKSSYEYVRTQELMPLIEQSDAVLDIHSSATIGSPPFVICGRQNIDEAKRLPFPLISYGWDALEPGGTDDYALRKGVSGITVECGFHKDPEAVVLAQEAIRAFLYLHGAINSYVSNFTSATPQEIEVISIHHTKSDFVPSRVFKDFEEVAKGDVMGTDGKDTIHVLEPGVVVFVRTRTSPKEEAFIFGKIVPPMSI